MRRRGPHMPDSMEMLLDTMCNTFGGIIFIAITMIVLSAMVSDRQKASSQNYQQVRMLEMLESGNKALDAGNRELRASISEVEKRIPANYRELKELRTENRTLEAGMAAANKVAADLESQSKQAVAENEEIKQKSDSRRTSIEEKLHELEVQERDTEVELKSLKAELRNTRERVMRFPVEERVVLKPYWVLLCSNKLYRLGTSIESGNDEVGMEEISPGRVRLLPLNGIRILESNAKKALPVLFADFPGDGHFVYLVTDTESFTALFHTRLYLRQQGIMINWMVNPDYVFQRAASGSYSASY
ncbi:MAG: hypothetical protein AB7F40_11895 [Victivallaceae bacterium]|nr:hypothetical protein [Victivallaceae bacterium]